MRGTVLILFLLSSLPLSAQLTYPEVDRSTYDLYESKDWKPLLDYGRQAEAEGFDFYYLNVRMGIACYQLGRFYCAESSFEKALQKRPGDALSNEYLYWIYRQTDRLPEAESTFESLPLEVQESIGKQELSPLDFIYVEAGAKLAPGADSAGHMYYGSAGLNQRFSSRFELYHAYSYFQQEHSWGQYQQHQYTALPRYRFDGGWQVGVGLNYFYYHSDIDARFEAAEDLGQTSVAINGNTLLIDSSALHATQLTGAYDLHGLGTTLQLSKQWRGWRFAAQGSWYGEMEQPVLQEYYESQFHTDVSLGNDLILSDDTTINGDNLFDEAAINHHFQAGLAVDYTWRFDRLRYLKLGLEVQYLFDEADQPILFAPYVQALLSERVSLSGYYLAKGHQPVTFFGGRVALNTYDQYCHRISLTGSYQINGRMQAFGTGQWDDVEDSLTGFRYQTFGLILGLKFKL